MPTKKETTSPQNKNNNNWIPVPEWNINSPELFYFFLLLVFVVVGLVLCHDLPMMDQNLELTKKKFMQINYCNLYYTACVGQFGFSSH